MFEVLKGKLDRNDRYFNLNTIQSFYIYSSTDGSRNLSVLLLNRVEDLSEKYYDIDDFVNRIKDRDNLVTQ